MPVAPPALTSNRGYAVARLPAEASSSNRLGKHFVIGYLVGSKLSPVTKFQRLRFWLYRAVTQMRWMRFEIVESFTGGYWYAFPEEMWDPRLKFDPPCTLHVVEISFTVPLGSLGWCKER